VHDPVNAAREAAGRARFDEAPSAGSKGPLFPFRPHRLEIRRPGLHLDPCRLAVALGEACGIGRRGTSPRTVLPNASKHSVRKALANAIADKPVARSRETTAAGQP
jgi:hypothetical protein